MKNFKLLMTFALCLAFGVSYGQVKVVTSGDTKVGDTGTAPLGQLHVTGTSELEYALDAAAGNPDFTFLLAGVSKAQVKYNNGLGGIQIGVNAANTGNGGIPGSHLFVSGAAGNNVGIGTGAPAEKLHVIGNIGYTGSLVNVSDKRTKQNVTDFQYGLNEVMALRPINFQYNGKANTPKKGNHVGLFAQDLQEVAPELVGSFVHQDWVEAADGESARLTGEEEFLNIKESAIKYMLINAIQEQQEMISAMETKIAELEATISRTDVGSSQTVSIANATLAQNAPNPFNQTTTINYAVPTKASNATLQIFDLNGAMLKSVNLAKGNGQVTINAGELAAGTYSYNLVIDGAIVDTKKMVLTK